MRRGNRLIISLLFAYLGLLAACGQIEESENNDSTPDTAVAVTTTTQSRFQKGSLAHELFEIHNDFEIDPSRDCYELQSPHEAYHTGVQRMTAVLWQHALVEGTSLGELEATFEEVSGFSIKMIPGNHQSVLVIIPTNRGHHAGCSSHYRSPDAFHVVDGNGAVWDLGTGGLLSDVWWTGTEWNMLITLRMDSSRANPTSWKIWRVGLVNGRWQKTAEYNLSTANVVSHIEQMQFENDYQKATADLKITGYPPCEFDPTFREKYNFNEWTVRVSYHLVNGTYEQVEDLPNERQIIDFPVFDKSTNEPADVQWQAYCLP